MNLIALLNILGFFLSLTGSLLVINKIKYGFLVFLGTELCFGTLAYLSGNYGILASCTMYVFTNCYGFYKWGGNSQLGH